MNAHHRHDRWSSPRPYTDTSLRRMKYGAILPMEEAASPTPPWLRLLQVLGGGLMVLTGFAVLGAFSLVFP